MDTFAGIVIPISTFVLGVLFSLLFNSYERRYEQRREAIKEALQLANDWYNQLHEIDVSLSKGIKDQLFESRVYFYVHNRLILPRLLFNLEVIRRYKKCKGLVIEVEDYLKMLTNYERGIDRDLRCKHCYELLPLGSENQAAKSKEERIIPINLHRFLLELDQQLHKINISAAKALS